MIYLLGINHKRKGILNIGLNPFFKKSMLYIFSFMQQIGLYNHQMLNGA